ncbi:hypothetical protein DXG01_002552 [Tephrocybe rancida]|nr:hypothetical protein DXG01_002552 [Tephrocybe rancida]
MLHAFQDILSRQKLLADGPSSLPIVPILNAVVLAAAQWADAAGEERAYQQRAEQGMEREKTSTGTPAFRRVEFCQSLGGPLKAVTATKKVILSAGSVGTPHTPPNSEIANAKSLQSVGIKALVNLPDIGQNLADHPVVGNPWLANSTDTFKALRRNTGLTDDALTQWQTSKSGPFVNTILDHIKFIHINKTLRLKETLPELLVPLTRLSELTQLDFSVILVSKVRWEDIRPPLGASPDPYFINVPPLSKEAIVQRLTSKITPPTDIGPNPLPPTSKGFYSHLTTTPHNICYPTTHKKLNTLQPLDDLESYNQFSTSSNSHHQGNGAQ